MRVLCSDEDDLLTSFTAKEVAVDNSIRYTKDGTEEELPCPCLHIKTEDYDIFIPMSHMQARSLVLEAYANDKVDISPFYSRTYYNPDAEEIEEIKTLLAFKTIGA